VLNVVVSKRHRRRGVGRALMAAARRLAKEHWGSSQMCTHVSAQNEVRAPVVLDILSCEQHAEGSTSPQTFTMISSMKNFRQCFRQCPVMFISMSNLDAFID
jgi:GNAT superfamily N-acetyltransferase